MGKIIDVGVLQEKHNSYAKVALMIELAEIAYDKHPTNKDPKARDHERSLKRYYDLGFPNIRFIENKDTDTQVYVVHDEDDIVIVFRGTENNFDWKNTNFNMEKVYPSRQTDTKCGKVHQGFHKAMSSVFDPIYDYVTSIPLYRSKNLYVCGHSLGAALTTQFTNFFDFKVPISCGYAVASPKSGDKEFVKQFDKRLKNRFFRLTNNADIVCKVPLYSMGFYHTEKELYINANGDVKEWNMVQRGFDQAIGWIKGLFVDNKGSIDDHHPCHYYAAFAKATGSDKRLEIWAEYR